MIDLAQQTQMAHRLPLDVREWVVLALVALMFVVVVGVLRLVSLYRKVEQEKEKRVRFRRRAIQFLAVGLIIPTILILALDGLLVSEALATIIGAFIGYVLSGIGEEND